MKRSILLLLCVIVCCSCHKTQPQSPSNKTIKKDSTELALMELNFRLAEEADREITQLIKNESTDTLTYTLHEAGFWYRYISSTKGSHFTDGNIVDIHIQIYDLENNLMLDSNEQITIGKRESAWCIDEAVKMMHQGSEMEILSPWYTGFGSTGNAYIPAYTNIKIKLSI